MAGERSLKTGAPKKSRGKRKKTRPGKGAGHALGIAIFVVSCAAALMIVYFALLVDKVEVQGCHTVSAESVLNASGIRAGQHMFLLDESGARAAILSDPYVESMELVREFPDTVILRVVERTARAIIADPSGDSVLIDGKGAVLRIGAQTDDALMLVYGMGNAGYTLGQSIDTGTDFQATSLVSILGAVDAAGLTGEVLSVNMANALSIELSLRSGYLVKLGQPDSLSDKLFNLSAVLKELKAEGKTGGVIYLAARGGPVYSPEETPETAVPQDTPDPGTTPDPDASPSPGESPEPSPTEGFSG
ncbi:MAG: FtsQ-type POTRA domain-containing protein [Clostridiaceae bacterium]